MFFKRFQIFILAVLLVGCAGKKKGELFTEKEKEELRYILEEELDSRDQSIFKAIRIVNTSDKAKIYTEIDDLSRQVWCLRKAHKKVKNALVRFIQQQVGCMKDEQQDLEAKGTQGEASEEQSTDTLTDNTPEEESTTTEEEAGVQETAKTPEGETTQDAGTLSDTGLEANTVSKEDINSLMNSVIGDEEATAEDSNGEEGFSPLTPQEAEEIAELVDQALEEEQSSDEKRLEELKTRITAAEEILKDLETPVEAPASTDDEPATEQEAEEATPITAPVSPDFSEEPPTTPPTLMIDEEVEAPPAPAENTPAITSDSTTDAISEALNTADEATATEEEVPPPAPPAEDTPAITSDSTTDAISEALNTADETSTVEEESLASSTEENVPVVEEEAESPQAAGNTEETTPAPAEEEGTVATTSESSNTDNNPATPTENTAAAVEENSTAGSNEEVQSPTPQPTTKRSPHPSYKPSTPPQRIQFQLSEEELMQYARDIEEQNHSERKLQAFLSP